MGILIAASRQFVSTPGRNRLVAGFAVAMAMSASSAAMAECTGTGLTGLGAGLLPFAGGSAVSSLVSAINTANTAFLTQSTAFVSAPANPKPDQEGGGVWARGIGGEIKTKSVSTTSNVSVSGFGVPGSINCNNETSLTFAGVQAGADIAHLNWGGWNVHVGATVGYLGAKARDTSAGGSIDPQGGTFTDSLQVPFAGVYAAATKGGFFIDGQLRTDFYQNSVNDPIVAGIFDQKIDARGLAFTANVGYNHALQSNWFIEPSAGIVVSKVKVDPLNVTGTLVLPASFTPGITFPGQLRIDDIKSTLGRLSLRGGTTIVSGNMIWQPFAIASVYHEFEGSVTSSFNGNDAAAQAGLLAINGNISSTNIGTYGQFGVGVAGQVANTGLLGYLRGDYRTGDNIEGYSLNGGVRYQFTPETVASAVKYAKAPIAKAPVFADIAYDWTGFFIGGNFGALNGKTDYETLGGGSSNPRFAGAIGGGQIGYDRQFGKWVVGIEGAIDSTNAHGARQCQFGIFFNCEVDVKYIGTATAKLGYAFWNRSLVYVRAGGAFGDLKLTTTCNTGPFNVFGVIGCGEATKRTRAGFTVGVGSEFAIARNWSVRTETNYFDMGKEDYTLPVSGVVGTVKESGFISTVGVNYRFAPSLVTAKY